MRMVFVETLIQLASQDDRICVVTPDMGYGILDRFRDNFPDRYFNLGICEQNCMSVAAGMALNGLKPYVYSIIPFVVHRCLEQIRVDVSYMQTDVKIVGVGSGFEYGAAGATHHGTEDIALMRALPNINVICPGDCREMKLLLADAHKINQPTYIRVGRHNHDIMNTTSHIKLGKASVITNGAGLVLIATGNMLPVAYDCGLELRRVGLNPAVISMHTVKPLDKACILDFVGKNYRLITMEEHCLTGGLGSAVAEVIAESGKGVDFRRIGVPDQYSHVVGTPQYIREFFKLDVAGVANQCY